jgi:hypothetical protein
LPAPGCAEALHWRCNPARCAAIAEEIARPVSYRPVETDGAERAAAILAELI